VEAGKPDDNRILALCASRLVGMVNVEYQYWDSFKGIPDTVGSRTTYLGSTSSFVVWESEERKRPQKRQTSTRFVPAANCEGNGTVCCPFQHWKNFESASRSVTVNETWRLCSSQKQLPL